MKAEKVYDQTFTARNFNTSPLTISGLKGDLYDYELICSFTNFGTSANDLRLRFNSDSASNYRTYRMRGYGSTANALVNDSQTYCLVGAIKSTIESLSIIKISGSSGDERYIDSFYCGENSANNEVAKTSCYWKDTANELTSLSFDYSSNVTTDAHIILYRTPKEASQEQWELMDRQSVTNRNLTTTPINFSGLKGDSDIQYRIEFNGEWSSGAGDVHVQLNSDSATNYKNQLLRNQSGSISASNFSTAGFQLAGTISVDTGINATAIINAESGIKRLFTSSESPIAGGDDQQEIASWWSNTADEVTEIDILQLSGSPSFSGTAKLYRRKNPNTIGDTLPFEMVEEVAVSGDFSAGHTFSGLSGDDVLMYKLEWLGDGDGTSRTNVNDLYLRAQFNGDTAANYINQDLRSYGSSADANNTTKNHIEFFNTSIGGLENEGQFTCYIYPKSGENRPCLIDSAVDYGNKLTKKGAGWWSNSSDEINSIKVFANQTYSITGTLRLSRLTI